MKTKYLIIEKREYVILKRLLNLSEYYGDAAQRYSRKKLSDELLTAKILDEADMPNDVVRLNSRLSVCSDNGWKLQFQLVSPASSDISKNQVSVLTPMGAAVVGYAKGDMITWAFPGGMRTVKIEEVEQNENPINLTVEL